MRTKGSWLIYLAHQDSTNIIMVYCNLHCIMQCNALCSLRKGTKPNQNLSLCYLHLVTASCSYQSQDGLDPLQLALLVLFLSTNAKIIYTRSGHYLQLALMVFFICQLAHLPVCTSTHGRTLQLAIVTSYVNCTVCSRLIICTGAFFQSWVLFVLLML